MRKSASLDNQNPVEEPNIEIPQYKGDDRIFNVCNLHDDRYYDDDQRKDMKSPSLCFPVCDQVKDGSRHKGIVHTNHKYSYNVVPFKGHPLIEHSCNSKCGCSKNYNINNSCNSA